MRKNLRQQNEVTINGYQAKHSRQQNQTNKTEKYKTVVVCEFP